MIEQTAAVAAGGANSVWGQVQAEYLDYFLKVRTSETAPLKSAGAKDPVYVIF